PLHHFFSPDCSSRISSVIAHPKWAWDSFMRLILVASSVKSCSKEEPPRSTHDSAHLGQYRNSFPETPSNGTESDVLQFPCLHSQHNDRMSENSMYFLVWLVTKQSPPISLPSKNRSQFPQPSPECIAACYDGAQNCSRQNAGQPLP